MVKILVVDDDASLRRVLEYNLKEAGYAVATAQTGEEALKTLEKESFDLVLTDIKMPGMDGMDLLRRVKELSPDTEVIVLTAFGTIEMAVEAMKAGAFEYVTKPFNRDELKLTVKKALRFRTLETENIRLRREVSRKFGFENIVGDSPAMQKVFRVIEKVADSEASVLITGESGTGKELVAKAIHYRSARSSNPFVAINCAAIPRELIESELFGHKRGAFTGAVRDKKGKFEEAEGGTLFLDEIVELPIDLQAKMLRSLQEREITPVGGNGVVKVDVRILSATNIDPLAAIQAGRFREDLYYRLAVVPIQIPPLRERREDIPLLISHFLKNSPAGKGVTFSREALRSMAGASWKGNVRELENTVERLLVLREGSVIGVDDLQENIATSASTQCDGGEGFTFTLPEGGVGLEDAEKAIITEALRRSDWNQSRTAQLLRIPRHVLLYRMEKFGISKK